MSGKTEGWRYQQVWNFQGKEAALAGEDERLGRVVSMVAISEVETSRVGQSTYSESEVMVSS